MALMISHEWGINITPVLASAGVIGLAFSLAPKRSSRIFWAESSS